MSVTAAASSEEIDRKIQDAGERLVILMFTSTGCAACRNVDSKVRLLSAEFGDKVMFIKVDVNASDDIAHRYHIHLLPTFMFLKYGKTTDKFSGADFTQLIKKIKEQLKK